MGHITIKDIAYRTGFSITTVSRVINGSARVKKSTREKIQSAIDSSGYSPSAAAISMKTSRMGTIAVLVPEIVTAFYAQIFNGVEVVASERGYSTVVFPSCNKSGGEAEFFKGRIARMVDGVIVVPSADDPKPYACFSKPVVMVDSYIEECAFDSITIDNYRCAYDLMRLLARHGHRRIAVVSGPLTLNVDRERVLGCRQALSELGESLSDELIFFGAWNEAHGFEATKRILGMSPRPSAIYATNSPILTGVLHALVEAGVSVPGDISVVGFDNPVLAQMMNPQITVIDRPVEMMGTIAARVLFERIENAGDSVKKRIIMPAGLLERGSVSNIG